MFRLPFPCHMRTIPVPSRRPHHHVAAALPAQAAPQLLAGITDEEPSLILPICDLLLLRNMIHIILKLFDFPFQHFLRPCAPGTHVVRRPVPVVIFHPASFQLSTSVTTLQGGSTAVSVPSESAAPSKFAEDMVSALSKEL